LWRLRARAFPATEFPSEWRDELAATSKMNERSGNVYENKGGTVLVGGDVSGEVEELRV
jgi:hypothetical protein